MHRGGSQSYRDEFAGFTQSIGVTFTPAFETLSGLFCSTVLKTELGTSVLSTSPLPFRLFYYPDVGKEPGGMDGGGGAPTSFNPVRKRECPPKTAVPATLETEVLIFENNPPHHHPGSVWFSKGTTLRFMMLHSYWSGSLPKGKWAHPRSWRTGSLLQAVCPWQSFLTGHRRGNKFAAALVTTLTILSIVMSCWPLQFQTLAL